MVVVVEVVVRMEEVGMTETVVILVVAVMLHIALKVM